jgi:hypothetical protein
MLVNRRSLLRQLESCVPGLSDTNNVDNSGCFVVGNNKIVTYNDEIRCCQDTELPFTFVVPSRPILDTLRKLTEDDLDINCDGKKLSIVCPGIRKININIQGELPTHGANVEEPGEWLDVVPAFSDGLAMVAEISSSKADDSTGCVHLIPKGLEATDGFQAIRYRVDVPIAKPALVKRLSCSAIKGVGVAAMCETGDWIHWKTYTGLVVSVRRYIDPFPNLNPYFGALGAGASSVKLPSTLTESLQQAAAFLPDSDSGKMATFRLSQGQLVIKGQNESGSYEERRAVPYEGPDVAFGLSPKYLENLLKHDYPCTLTDSTLRVRGESFIYVTSKELVDV